MPDSVSEWNPTVSTNAVLLSSCPTSSGCQGAEAFRPPAFIPDLFGSTYRLAISPESTLPNACLCPCSPSRCTSSQMLPGACLHHEAATEIARAPGPQPQISSSTTRGTPGCHPEPFSGGFKHRRLESSCPNVTIIDSKAESESFF